MALLATVLAPELSAEQLDRRWQEHGDGNREILVAALAGQVVDTVSTTGHRFQRPDSLRLFGLDVRPVFRGQGIGPLWSRRWKREPVVPG